MTEYDKVFILLVSDQIVYTKSNMSKIVHTREEDRQIMRESEKVDRRYLTGRKGRER